jgi:spore coat polysaccharide biosynthesis predicted glycosyltransferase SpsG
MHFGFRVASDPRFGSGHLARCRALAQALCENATLFADPGQLLEAERSNWAQIVLEESAESVAVAIEALSLRRLDALVIDSYAISADAVAKAAVAGTTIVFRDDQSYGAEQITIDCNPGAKPRASVISGSSFMPLTPIFAEMHERARQVPACAGRPGKLMIAFGARDSANYTGMALDAVSRLADKPRATVVLAESALHRDLIMRKLEVMPWAERLNERQALNGLYGNFDLAIGAPGVSQFERACCGLPTILLAQNEKQKPLTAAWATSGAAVGCEPEVHAVEALLAELMSNPKPIAAVRERGLNMVDGRGALRLAEALKARLVH